MKMASQSVLPYAQILQELSHMSILYTLPNVMWPYGATPIPRESDGLSYKSETLEFDPTKKEWKVTPQLTEPKGRTANKMADTVPTLQHCVEWC